MKCIHCAIGGLPDRVAGICSGRATTPITLNSSSAPCAYSLPVELYLFLMLASYHQNIPSASKSGSEPLNRG